MVGPYLIDDPPDPGTRRLLIFLANENRDLVFDDFAEGGRRVPFPLQGKAQDSRVLG